MEISLAHLPIVIYWLLLLNLLAFVFNVLLDFVNPVLTL